MPQVINGVTCLYGVNNTTVSNAIVQSYSAKSSFNNEATVIDESGKTVTWRGDDRKTEVSIELIAKTASMPVLGSDISISINTASSYHSGNASDSFGGWITAIEDKGSNKDFTMVSITAIGYEGIN